MTLQRKKSYQIVQFKDNTVDCVPLFWISLYSESLQLVTKFMPPPYTEKTCKDFHKLVEAARHPEDSWPTYGITLLDETGMMNSTSIIFILTADFVRYNYYF